MGEEWGIEILKYSCVGSSYGDVGGCSSPIVSNQIRKCIPYAHVHSVYCSLLSCRSYQNNLSKSSLQAKGGRLGGSCSKARRIARGYKNLRKREDRICAKVL